MLRRAKAPYGFAFAEDGEELMVAEEEMAVVRRNFRAEAVEGRSLSEIIRDLNSEGVPAPSGGLWHRPSVRYLWLSELYRPLTVEEVVTSGPVSAEAARALDPEEVFGLWCWNRTRQKKWWDRGENGEIRTRYKVVPRLRGEWSAVPVPLSDAGLSRGLVDAARERISQNERRPSSIVAQRFWQLSGGIARCAVCGSALSPHTTRRPSGKNDCYYRRRQRYGNGARDCTHTRSYRAVVLEEAVWNAVYDLLSDPERIKREYEQHVERQRRQMRGDPDREALNLAGKLEQLQSRRSGHIDLAADGLMSREDLRTKLAEAESQREELERALRQARDRRQSSEEFERQWHIYAQLVEHFDRVSYLVASDADRRRLYQALRLQASVGAEGTIRLSGIFDPDVYLPGVLQDPPANPSKPVPKVPEGTRVVVSLDSYPQVR